MERCQSGVMLQRAEALSDDFIPGDVVHRHRELDRLASALQPVLKGCPPEHALLFGPSGAGKTCMAKYSLSELVDQHLGIETAHIDCWQHHTRRKVLERLCIGCGRGAIIHEQLAHDAMLDRIREVDGPYVVVLDEVDQLDDMTILREVYGMEGVAVVGITNRKHDLLGRVNEWLSTRIRSCVTIRLEAYNDDQLVDILARRADESLRGDAISEAQLQIIATRSEGNAGLAIAALRQAAQKAHRGKVDVITDDMIKAALPAARAKRRQKSISRLTHDQRELFEQLPDDGSWISGSGLHEAYEVAVDDPAVRRTRRYWLSKMQQYNLIEQRGSGRAAEYSRRLSTDISRNNDIK